jgi:hypothetical protein
MIGQYEKEMFWLATRARHWGHSSIFITQRPAQISPTVRDQCGMLFLFRVSRDDAVTLARDWTREELAQAMTLNQFEYLHATRFGNVTRGRVTLDKDGPISAPSEEVRDESFDAASSGGGSLRGSLALGGEQCHEE